MDRIERPKDRSEFAKTGEVDEADAAALPSATGREGGSRVDIVKPIARPRSEVTGRHDEGSGANETVDGLAPIEEAIRRGAEDIPTGAPEPDVEDLPVFDRADALPKV